MAPELALEKLQELKGNSVVLDPMVGSGTVLHHAISLGHQAMGFDLDPLAVLMSRVRTSTISKTSVQRLGAELVSRLGDLRDDEVHLPWIDDDDEAKKFANYWFGRRQRNELRRVSYALSQLDGLVDGKRSRISVDVLRIALSRTIITKQNGASLAWDVSHSRPHKVKTRSTFDVVPAFQRSLQYVLERLPYERREGRAIVKLGDARKLDAVEDRSVDLVLTSPPYLNAIDYLRGHRLSLIWLGYPLKDLRKIRSNSIGAERSPDPGSELVADEIKNAMASVDKLPPRYNGMIERYAVDLRIMLSEISRVLSEDGTATFVIGDSRLKGVFIENSAGLKKAAEVAGLKQVARTVRELPSQHRYLPTPSEGALGKRMKTETILSFALT